MGGGRLVGILMIIGAAALGLVGALFLIGQMASGLMTIGAVMSGVIVGTLVLLPLIGIGIVMIARGGKAEAAAEERKDLRKILDMVETRGQVQIRDIVLELGSGTKEVHDDIHALVGMGLFSGYINWDEGTLYSSEASNLRGLERCNHCGGEVKFAGKGVLTCPWCGTEYFLN